MKLRLLVATLTVLVFAIGFGAGVWTQRHRALLSPPIGLLGEIRNHSFDVHLQLNDPAAVAKINAEIEQMKPDIEAFRQRLDVLNEVFRRDFEAILTADQRAQFEKMHKRYEDSLRAKRATSPLPTVQPTSAGGATLTLPFFNEPVEGMTSIIVVPLALDHLTDQLKLDDHQRAALRQLLLQRREKFLALIDATPPPSIRLNRLAPIINKFAGPPPPPPPPGNP
ncbi:MAG TPA: hypothetical protein VMI53_08725 [Opitutaceae bacterium]|nr:hypothetical protein [Opitutaceae bacterium]